MIGFDDTMPIGAMTIGDLKLLMHDILETAAGKNATKRTTSSAKLYVYGIKGIEELFGCSHATTQPQANESKTLRPNSKSTGSTAF